MNCLLLYRGWLGWIQYIPLKRARFGINSSMLCESNSGAFGLFYLYRESHISWSLPMSSSTVMTLWDHLMDIGYCFTIDNFYTTPELSDLLIYHRTDSSGVLKLLRKGVPEALKKTSLKRGDIPAYQIRKVFVMRWKHKKMMHCFPLFTIVKSKRTPQKICWKD